MKKTTKSRPK